MTQIKIKRVYEDPAKSDGYRVLVDRLWPRGMKKEMLKYDYWAKEATPSSGLRAWYHEDPEGRRDAFTLKYKEELDNSPSVKDFIAKISVYDTVTLLYAAKDTVNNHAVILKAYIDGILSRKNKG